MMNYHLMPNSKFPSCIFSLLRFDLVISDFLRINFFPICIEDSDNKRYCFHGNTNCAWLTVFGKKKNISQRCCNKELRVSFTSLTLKKGQKNHSWHSFVCCFTGFFLHSCTIELFVHFVEVTPMLMFFI